MAIDKVLDRRHLVWAACDELAKRGIKPSVSAIKREGLPLRGSDPDVQRDVNEWFDGVLLAHTNKHEVAGIPQTLTTLLAGVVEAIREEARRELAVDRQAMEEKIASAVQMSIDADVRTAEALARAQNLAGELAVATESIAGRDATVRRLEEALSELRSTAASIEERHIGQLLVRDERIASLTADFARKEMEYKARIVELDGIRKHALLQIDDARSESRLWREKFNQAESDNKNVVATYRQKSSMLDAQLAAANGRLAVMDEIHAKMQLQLQALERELAESKAQQESKKGLAEHRREVRKSRRGKVLLLKPKI